MQVRSRSAIERFFDGLDLIEPGVVSLPKWRPDPSEISEPGQPSDAAVSVYGGIGRKPSTAIIRARSGPARLRPIEA